MTRDVTCYVTDNTGDYQQIDVSSVNVWNGESTKGGTAPQPINSSAGNPANNQLIFYFHKTTAGSVGVTGQVIYKLSDGTNMVLSFNNPYHQNEDDPTYINSNIFFYAGLTNVQANGTYYYLTMVVTIDGNTISGTTPPSGSKLVANITLNNSSKEIS